jgi:hypothetical protein
MSDINFIWELNLLHFCSLEDSAFEGNLKWLKVNRYYGSEVLTAVNMLIVIMVYWVVTYSLAGGHQHNFRTLVTIKPLF